MRMHNVLLLLIRSSKALLPVQLLSAPMETLLFFTGGRSSLLTLVFVRMIWIIRHTEKLFIFSHYRYQGKSSKHHSEKGKYHLTFMEWPFIGKRLLIHYFTNTMLINLWMFCKWRFRFILIAVTLIICYTFRTASSNKSKSSRI